MLFTHRRHELLQKSEEAVQCIYQALCIFCPDHPLVLGKQPGVPGLNQGRKSQGLVLGMDFGIWIRHWFCSGIDGRLDDQTADEGYSRVPCGCCSKGHSKEASWGIRIKMKGWFYHEVELLMAISRTVFESLTPSAFAQTPQCYNSFSSESKARLADKMCNCSPESFEDFTHSFAEACWFCTGDQLPSREEPA